MNETEIHVFCPKDALVWEENCLNVEFMNFTAISEFNEFAVVNALRNSLYGLLASYPSTKEEDLELIKRYEDGDTNFVGPIMYSAYQLRYREKEILHSTLEFLDEHEEAIRNGTVIYQLEIKAKERLEADLRDIGY
jgi:hypothetical protein